MAKAVTADGDAPGMERGELKIMLKFARREPVRVAFAQDKEGKIVIVMDKRKPPRVLDRDLKEKLDDGRNHRFGTAEVAEDQPKLVKFMVNKASPGIARRLVIALKGTGFNKVEINSEDGAPVEKHEEPDPDDIEEQTEKLDRLDIAKPEAPAAEPLEASTPQPASKPAATDTGQLVARLVTAVGRMRAIIAADPEQKSSLQKLATAAQTSLRDGMLTLQSGDIDRATAEILAVEQAVERAAKAAKPAQAAKQPDAAEVKRLTTRLTTLAKQAMPLIKADPARAPQLKEHLVKANASLKSGDIDKATQHIDLLGQLCGGGLAQQSGMQGGSSHQAADPAFARTADTLWGAIISAQAEIDRVSGAFAGAFAAHAAGKEIIKRFGVGVSDAKNGMTHGHALVDKLRAAAKAQERGTLIAEAQTLLKQGLHHLTTNPLLAIIDANPVVKVKVKATLQAGYAQVQRLLDAHPAAAGAAASAAQRK